MFICGELMLNLKCLFCYAKTIKLEKLILTTIMFIDGLSLNENESLSRVLLIHAIEETNLRGKIKLL